jgi:hypothetical protein
MRHGNNLARATLNDMLFNFACMLGGLNAFAPNLLSSYAKGIKSRVESGSMWKKYLARYGLRETAWEMFSREKNTNASSDVFKKESFPMELVSSLMIATARVI